MRRTSLIVLFATIAVSVCFSSLPVFAQIQINGGASAGPDLGQSYPAYSGEVAIDPRIVVANIIRIVLSILGILALVLILYAGFEWMTAGGNDEQIATAKKILYSSVVGLAIILSAYSIALFVTISLTNASAAGTSVLPF